MSETSKIKWVGSIVLAGTLLVMALLGGNWGTNYSASASALALPHIDSIIPSAVPAGSPDTIMIIIGSNFGNVNDTAVRLKGITIDEIILPQQVLPNGISVNIPSTYLTDPALYIVTVVKSTLPSIPTVPITPWDQESNQVSFSVFAAQFIHLPFIHK
jgi:hypothetical protein